MYRLTLALLLLSSTALAAPHVVGPQACQGNCPNWQNELTERPSVDGGAVNVPIDVSLMTKATANAKADADARATSSSNAAGGDASASVGDIVGGDVSTSVANAINFESVASTAYAAGLTASAGTCMGSTSVGGQGVSFGISVGSTWSDDDCNRRRYSAILQSLGETEAAIQLLCFNREVQLVLARCLPIALINQLAK